MAVTGDAGLFKAQLPTSLVAGLVDVPMLLIHGKAEAYRRMQAFLLKYNPPI